MSEITKRPYNGWNNYATFRVHHDILNGYQWDEGEDIYVDLLKAIVQNTVFENTGAVGLIVDYANLFLNNVCLLYTSPSPRDGLLSRMPSSA